jgi:ABC-2 type transport system permease protein
MAKNEVVMSQIGVAPVRHIGLVNWLGLYTLTSREVRRFGKVYFQTLLAPIATTLVFLAIFMLAMGRASISVGAVPFAEFLAPGLIMMAMTQNAFANTSSSLTILKSQGNIVDVLMPPLSPLELTLAFAAGGMARGLAVGILVSLAMALFIPFHIANLLLVIYYALAASLLLSLLGIAAGIWADKFDHMAAVTNFIITPLSFLSGTFYSIERLPVILRNCAFANPFFYMIDGFRAAFIGHADGSLAVGACVVGVTDIVLGLLVYSMFRSGYKLKA